MAQLNSTELTGFCLYIFMEYNYEVTREEAKASQILYLFDSFILDFLSHNSRKLSYKIMQATSVPIEVVIISS
jgi:hypothetical protein